MPTLLALFGPKRGVRLELDAQGTILGRSSDADLQLVDGKVSRRHCRFAARGDELTVEDLGSHNGTYVNGDRLTGPYALAAGDEIAVGDSLFVMDGPADVATARFGDTTLVITSSEDPPAGEPDAEPDAEPAAVGDDGGATPADARLAQVAALAATLQAAPDLEPAARAVLAAMDVAFGAQRAFVLLCDGAKGLARPLVGRSEVATVSVSRTVLDRAARRGRAIALDDAVADRDLGKARSVVRHQLRAVLVAPIVLNGAVVGFLHADRDRPSYAAGDAALLDCFAALFASSLGRGGSLPGEAHAAAAMRAAPTSRGREGGADRPPAGGSASLRAALDAATAAAATASTVLVTGETGTGKEEIARHVHRRSARRAGPFVAINCGAIPEGVAESELFGHEKGAFTGAATARPGKFEAADGGTLFLDEVGELSPANQVRLLRVLQERVFYRVGSTVARRVDLRVIAATHGDLEAAVAERRFREDLFYRLAVIRIRVAPLRERPEDVAPIARALLQRLCAELGRAAPAIDGAGLRRLERWPWPGNVRELGNVLERALVLRAPPSADPLTGDEIDRALGDAGPRAVAVAPGASLADKVAGFERAEIEAALRRARGVKSRAAQALGMSRPTLDKKIADLAIDPWTERA